MYLYASLMVETTFFPATMSHFILLQKENSPSINCVGHYKQFFLIEMFVVVGLCLNFKITQIFIIFLKFCFTRSSFLQGLEIQEPLQWTKLKI